MAAQTTQYQRELPPPPPAHYHQQQTQPPAQQYQQQQYNQQQYNYQQQPSQASAPSNQSVTTAQHQRQYSHSQEPLATKARAFSFHSDKSHKSGNSKSDLYETPAQKEAKRLHSKADPTLAISEATPAEIAMTESSLGSLRSIQHRDSYGNPIADPDKSNPTRSRWERPLDTIRSFESAIDGGYNRKSMMRAGMSGSYPVNPRKYAHYVMSETDSVANWNRRSSFHPAAQPRTQRNSYYGSRPVSYRPDLNQMAMGGQNTARNSYYDEQGYDGGYNGSQYNGYGGGPSRQRPARMSSEPHYQLQGRTQNQNGYHLSHKDRSYETVSSAAGTGNSDQQGYQTDPTSSDNSSIERQSPARKPVNDYGIGFSQSQSYQAPNFSIGVNGNSQHPLPPTPQGIPTHGMGPAVPRKEVASVLRRQPTATKQDQPEKRKSWFARRFSKTS